MFSSQDATPSPARARESGENSTAVEWKQPPATSSSLVYCELFIRSDAMGIELRFSVNGDWRGTVSDAGASLRE